MIKNIVFDIGGVLADYRIKEFLAEKGFDGPMIKRILKASLMSPYWGRFERGEVTEEETLKGFAEADPDIEKELRAAYADLSGMLVMKEFAIDLVKSLKDSGYAVFYLSNYSKKAYDECAESLAFMPFMDGGVVSFKVGLTKPDPAMFQKFLSIYDLKPEECLFIDDTPENVEAATDLGFQGLTFQSYEQLIRSLQEAGIKL